MLKPVDVCLKMVRHGVMCVVCVFGLVSLADESTMALSPANVKGLVISVAYVNDKFSLCAQVN